MITYHASSCGICNGTLVYNEGENECSCASGGIPGYKVHKYSLLPLNVFYSHEVLEEFDAAEYNNLTDTQKDAVLVILSCGIVDLNDGKASKTRLWSWFGAGSTTITNLTALLI